MAAEQVIERGHREVAEMLVIDRVELAVLDQVDHVGHLEHREAVRLLEQNRDPRDQAVQVRDVGEHVVGDDQIGGAALGPQSTGERRARRSPGASAPRPRSRPRPAPPPDRCRARESRARRSSSACSRRCWRSRPPATRGRVAAARSAPRRCCENVGAGCRTPRRSTGSRRRTGPRDRPSRRSGPGCIPGRTSGSAARQRPAPPIGLLVSSRSARGLREARISTRSAPRSGRRDGPLANCPGAATDAAGGFCAVDCHGGARRGSLGRDIGQLGPPEIVGDSPLASSCFRYAIRL